MTGGGGRRWGRWVAAGVPLLVVLALAAGQWEEMSGTLRRVDLTWFAVGALCYLFNYLLRAARMRSLLASGLPLWPTMYRVVALHGAATYLLPMRLGDLALPAILRSLTKEQWRHGLRVLFQARLLDLGTLGLWILAAALVLPAQLPDRLRWAWAGCGVALATTPWLLTWGASKLSLHGRWAHWGERLRAIGRFSVADVAVSCLIWLAVGSVFYCAARAVGLSLEVGDIWFLVTIQLPLQLMPVQGIANTGNHEAGWVAALVLLGVESGEAFRFAVATHVLLMGYVLLLTIMGLLCTVVTQKEALPKA